jgi:ankyrin repeat protein
MSVLFAAERLVRERAAKGSKLAASSSGGGGGGGGGSGGRSGGKSGGSGANASSRHNVSGSGGKGAWSGEGVVAGSGGDRGIAYATDSRGNLPVHVACEHDSPEVLAVLATYAPETLCMVQGNDRYPMHVAAARGASRCVEYLLSAKAAAAMTAAAAKLAKEAPDPAKGKAAAGEDESAAGSTAGGGGGAAGLTAGGGGALGMGPGTSPAVLVPAPTFRVADPLDADQCTPLHLAAVHGHAQCVAVLIAASASASARDALGVTPYEAAAAAGRTAVTRILAGALESTDAGKDEEDSADAGKAVRIFFFFFFFFFFFSFSF